MVPHVAGHVFCNACRVMLHDICREEMYRAV